MTLGSCPYNSEWLKIGYGDQALDKLKDFPISCVGSFSGGRLRVCNHLYRLTGELKSLQKKTHKPQDQSCHNFIIRNNKNDDQTIWGNEVSEIYTVGYIPYGTVEIKENTILNKNGCAPCVIHQWERHPNLTELVNRLYS